jgi:type I restriction-modification system DNA methylase subunit
MRNIKTSSGSAPETVVRLCRNFTEHLDHYKSQSYNETELRREYLDPFFKALGWDIDNERGYADAYKDVIHEDAIKIGGYTKAPDYCFRIGGARKFFLEAKKPAVDIRDGTDPAYQLRRYAWSAKLPLSILSDFEELSVYDCRVCPKPRDKASTARTLLFHYTEYADRWHELADVFSREAVLRGSFDKYAEKTRTKRGTAEVDDAFLQEIERWREALARNFALRNAALSVRDLNYAVQKTIDRIIFLRICEDRGTEDYRRLRTLVNGANAYRRMIELFRRADERYNSGLFHFEDEKNRGGTPDTLTPELNLDEKVLQDIIRNLYYPESPYEFSVLPADILGQVYERFLGKTIRLTAGHQAKIEEKPEVRKAGGVYYTPKYIVDYIVKNTLGRLLNGPDLEKPQPISLAQAEKIKLVDPACGSGSFLIVAYQYLLDWHRDRYTLHPDTRASDPARIRRYSGGKRPKIYQAPGGEWKLTTSERKRILLANIHGVDIDSQAVEVTKLSLLLKVLEGETQQRLQRDFLAERQRILPDLGRNIQCGNSLIGPDFYEQEQMLLLDDETRYRINVFDWQAAFPDVFKQGGFDCVIGNPPYISIQAMKEFAPDQLPFFHKRFLAATKGNYDIYALFVEKGLELIHRNAVLGFILPNKFFATDYGEPLRRLISSTNVLDRVVDFGHGQVFRSATTYTCLLFLSKHNNRSEYAQVSDPVMIAEQQTSFETFSNKQLGASSWLFQSGAQQNILDAMDSAGTPLLELPSTMSRGSSTGCDAVFCLAHANGKLTNRDGQIVSIEKELLRIPLYATDFNRWNLMLNDRERIIFPYRVEDDRYSVIPEQELKTKYPRAYSYLLGCKTQLTARKQYNAWYGFSAPRALHLHDQSEFLVPLLANHAQFAPATSIMKKACLMASGGFSIQFPSKEKRLKPVYIMGLLNSTLLFWYLEKISNKFRGGWITCTKQYFGRLPIRPIDFDNPADVAFHDKMVQLVERMLDLNRKKAEERNPETLRRLETDIAVTDRQIDRLVYELYNLTPAEIGIVEGAAL